MRRAGNALPSRLIAMLTALLGLGSVACAATQPISILPMHPAREIAFTTAEGSWLSPDLSPDGRRIAFELLGDIYLVDAQGGTAHAIASGMPFDSQPAFSPDGTRIAFLSDRTGPENIWTMAPDGSAPRAVTHFTGDTILTSPSWSADGTSIFVSRFHPEYVAFELLRVDVASGRAETLVGVGDDKSSSTVGAEPSADGRWLYYASQVGSHDSSPPAWVIRRRDLASNAEETLVEPPRSYRPDLVLGTYFRPLPSPDGKLLVYATRYGSDLWLRVLDLQTGDDRWLAKLAEHDELESTAWRDFAPHYAFAADSRSLIVNDGGVLERVALADGAKTPIRFTAAVRLPLGALNRPVIREERGPVRARIIQNPVASPEGKTLAFSALGQIYTLDLRADAKPRRVTRDPFGEFQPSWSPDGRSLLYVRWTARDGGQIFRVDADGARPPTQLTTTAAYYTSPVFTPNGRNVVAERSSNSVRMHRYMEYGLLRDAELVIMPASGGDQRVIAKGSMGGTPHFGPDEQQVAMLFDNGLKPLHSTAAGGD